MSKDTWVNIVPENRKTKHPYDYNFNKMCRKTTPKRMKPFRVRLADYMNEFHLTPSRFADLSREMAGPYGTKVTEWGIKHYLYDGISPKIDKLYAVCQVMDVPISYFCGYSGDNPDTKGPFSKRWTRTFRSVFEEGE